MKKISLLVCICVLSSIAFKSNAQSTSWFLSASSANAINIQKVVQLSDNSTVIAGIIQEPMDSMFYQPSYLVIARIADNGTVEWAKKSNEAGYAITGMSEIDNALFITYDFTDYDSLTTKSMIMKMDANGNVLKNISLISQGFGQYAENKFLKLPNNNIILMRSVFYQFEIQCFNSSLDLLWSRRVEDSTAGKNPAMNLCLDNSGNLLICGKRENSLELLSMTTSGDYIFGKTFDDPSYMTYLRAYNIFPVSDGFIIQGMLGLYNGSSFIVKANAQGDIVWMKTLEDANNSEYNFSITNGAALQNGHFLFSGYTSTGRNVIGEMDATGNIQWSKILQNNGIAYYATSSLYLNGNNIVTTYSKNIYPYGDGAAILKTNLAVLSNGNICDFVSNAVTVSDLTFSYTVNTIGASNLVDLPVSYVDEAASLMDFSEGIEVMEICSTVGINTVESNQTFEIYPVPASDNVNIHFDNTSTVTSVRIYDVLGKLIFNEDAVSKSELTIPVAVFASGVYSVQVACNGNISKQKFVVQH